MIRLFERHTNGRTVLLFLVAAAAVYTFMMAVSIPAATAAASGLPIFDMRPMGYGVTEARAFLAAITADGRSYYQHVQLVADLLYPPLLGLLGAFTLAWIRRRVRFPRVLILLPLAGALFDYLENLGILLMLRGNEQTGIILGASTCSICKSMLTTLFMSLILVTGVIAAVRSISEPKGQADGIS